MDLSARAFAEYDRRSERLDGDETQKQRWFYAHVASSYLPHLPSPRDSRILEIGCNRGYLLKALQAEGYASLTGIDLNESDLAVAQQRTGLTTLRCVDAVEYLHECDVRFDAIILKAVLEHVSRDDLDALLGAVARAVAADGVVLCEVPNMDWYAAAHERYMDLTHRNGYTQESLDQLMHMYFRQTTVVPLVDPAHGALAPAWRVLLRRVAFGAFRRILRLLGEDPAGFPFEFRSIMAVASQPASSAIP